MSLFSYAKFKIHFFYELTHLTSQNACRIHTPFLTYKHFKTCYIIMMSLFFYAILKIISTNTYEAFFFVNCKKMPFNPFVPTVPTFAVRETASLGIMGAPRVPPLCRETQSLGQQMLNAPLGINGLKIITRELHSYHIVPVKIFQPI